LEEDGEEFLRGVGISRGMKILDFGCGSGNYAIPTARIVGEEGKVYALDEDERALDELTRRAESQRLENIARMEPSGELKIELEEDSVDMVLLYDVLHYYYFPHAEDRKRLLREIYRILKLDGQLSLYPSHLQSNMHPRLEDVKREINEVGFYLECEYSGTLLVHGNILEESQVLNFIKKKRMCMAIGLKRHCFPRTDENPDISNLIVSAFDNRFSLLNLNRVTTPLRSYESGL